MTSSIFWGGDQATRWWWVRHAPADVPRGMIYGQDDTAAVTDDVATFSALARLLPADAVLVTSNLRRTHQTATAIGAAGLTLAEPLVEDDFAEQNFGDWQGRSFDDVREEAGPNHPFWLTPASRRAPNGESFSDVSARVVPVVERLTRTYAGRDIIAVAHGGTIRAALGHALGLDTERALGFNLHNCSVTRLDFIGPTHYHPAGSWAVIHTNYRANGH